MPVIVESNAAAAELFIAALPEGPRVPSLDALKSHLAANLDEYAVVLGPSVDLEAAAALADTLRVTKPAISVILIRRRVDTSVLAEALRSGMREVLEEGDLAGLSSAVRRAHEIWQALASPTDGRDIRPRARTITIFSPKGGVGKTTLAVNLALALAEQRDKKVCLVDLDLAFGDVAITLQLFPTHTIADAAGVGDTLDSSLIETLLINYRDNLSALVAPVQPDAKEAMSANLIARTLQILKSTFDFVVVDTAPNFDEHVLQAFDETDELLLVTTLDVPTLKNVKIAIETFDLLNFPVERRHLVLNRADDKVGLDSDKVTGALGMSITATIPTSLQVANSTNAGEPIISSSPSHPVSHAIRKLAERVASEVASPAPERERAHRAVAKRGIFRKRVVTS